MNDKSHTKDDVADASGQAAVDAMDTTWFGQQAAIGYAQLEAGQTVNIESKEQFFALLRGRI